MSWTMWGKWEVSPVPLPSPYRKASLFRGPGLARAAGARPGASAKRDSTFSMAGCFPSCAGPWSSLPSCPTPLPGIQLRGPQRPMGGGGSLGGAGGGGHGSGQVHCLEKKELTSAPGAGPPTPPGFLLPGCRSGLCPPYLGIEKPHCTCGPGVEPQTHRVASTFAATLRGSVTASEQR